MKNFALAFVVLSVAGVPVIAGAQDEPCGNFDFSGGFDCRIEVEGGCTAECTPMSFEVGCTGQCTASAETQCVDSCGEQCILTCNPEALDCFVGCHGECDGPVTEQCEADQASEDCAETARAQCDIHCNQACEVPPSDCQEHCTQCCTGSCTTSVNFDCNIDCFAELEGGCVARCEEPSGAIFCNGQYVHASDVEACITWLATQGIEVDVTARGEVTCDMSGCEGEGEVSGCSAIPSQRSRRGAGLLAFGFGLVGIALGRRRQNGPRA